MYKHREKQSLHLYRRHKAPTVAPGLEDDELYVNATREEVAEGDTTMVTRLSWDENDNGSSENSES